MAKRTKRNPVSAPRAADKGGKRSKRSERTAKVPSRGAGRALDLGGLSTEMLAAELERRRSELPRLERRAAELRAELAAVEARIAALGGAPSRGRRGRAAGRPSGKSVTGTAMDSAPRRRGGKPTLGEHIVEFLQAAGGVHAPSEIAEDAARRLGREVNTSLVVQVSATLRKLVNGGRVRQVGRGRYEIGVAQSGGADAS